MGASKARLLFVIFVAQLLTPILTVRSQTSPSLSSRIPKPDPNKYQVIRDGKDWRNPYLVVRPEGIEIYRITPPAQGVPVESVLDILKHLPDSAWPYGLVVVVSDVGVLSSRKDVPRINANRSKLMKTLKRQGIAVELWPSA
jgi:hypothetical protein